MRVFRPCLLAGFCLLVSGLLLVSQGRASSRPDSRDPLRVQLQTYPARVVPGQRVWLALRLAIDAGWHIYGNPKGPGPGRATTLEVLSLPAGVQAEPARFLPAEKVLEPGFDPGEWNWAYQGGTTIYLPLSTSRDLQLERHRISLRLRALLCKAELCLPYQRQLQAVLTVVGTKGRQSRIPPEIEAEIKRTHPGQAGRPKQAAFGPSLTASEMVPAPPAEIPPLTPRPLHRGLEVGSFIQAVLFALVAGFILNFMPCVLPVVSLKVLGFLHQAEKGRQQASLLGLSFAAGILLVFLLLAGLASYAGYGWGELFQKQAFLIGMIAVVFVMSLSIFGLFRLAVPGFAARVDASTGRGGYWDSFCKGIVATLLATPCSAPLLGGAMAWTLRQPPPVIFATFTCIGLGMGLPYVVISLFPGTLSLLPRPGPWLLHFERLMGFALLATVIYLIAILPAGRRIWVLVFCLFLAVGFYIWGQMTGLTDSHRRRLLVRLAAVAIMATGGWLTLKVCPWTNLSGEAAPKGALTWHPYSEARLLAAAREKCWVVVDFTADWCPNCILVERTALNDRRVLEIFRQRQVLLLKADLTRENPPAKRLLEKLGSRSIPFLAVFPPGELFWQPFFLRDIYRAQDIIGIFRTRPPG